MGANYDEMELDGKLTETQLQKAFREAQDSFASESGNSYSGRLNMCSGLTIGYETFASYDDAYNYIESKAQKWGDAVAVRYKVVPKVEASAEVLKLRERLTSLQTDLRTLQTQITEAVGKKLTSVEFITCSSCKSRMDTRFKARGYKCPVCNGSFASSTDQKKRLALEAKITDLEQKIEQKCTALVEKAKAKNKDAKTMWLIGGVCSC